MASHRTNLASDSLELLLDTICNVFGGIILMAILVVLLTQTSADQVPDPTAEELETAFRFQQLRLQQKELRQRLAELNNHRRRLQETLWTTTPEPAERLADAYDQFQKAIRKASERLEEAKQAMTESRSQHGRLSDYLRRTEKRLQEKRREVEHLQEQLNHLEKVASRNVRLPHRRGAVQGEAKYFIIKGQKAYYVGFRHRGHHHLHLENIDIVSPIEGIYEQQVHLIPRPSGGVTVPENLDAAWLFGLIQHCGANNFDPIEAYFVFFVWNDSESYATFQRLKNAVLAQGYSYCVFPKTPSRGGIRVEPSRLHESE